MDKVSLLTSVPDHPLLHILSFLKYSDLTACAQVCRRLHRLTCYQPLWRRQCRTYWDVHECDDGMSWRDCFIEWYKDFGRYVDVYRSIHRAWDQIRSFTEKNCPTIWETIVGGMSESRLDEWERSLHVPLSLPNDYRCACRIFHGQDIDFSSPPPGLLGTIESSGAEISTILCMPGAVGKDVMLSMWMNDGEEIGYELMALTDQDGFIPGQIYYSPYGADANAECNTHGEFITGSSFLSWFTAYAQQLADNTYPVVNGHIYRFYHEPGTVAVTNNIKVSVATAFVTAASSIDPPHFSHAYRITMSMDSSASQNDSCQLSTRSWTITDEEGTEEKVEGPGVVGEYPVMCPGVSYTWISGTHFTTTYGNMHGHFTMTNLRTGATVDVECPTFHMKCLPYQTAEERSERALRTKKMN